MCTVTLYRTPERFLLTMNRDEAKSRAPERPPSIASLPGEGLQWLGPRDSARGGTWLGANNEGLAACVMNGNVPLEETLQKVAAGAPTRGQLVPMILARGAFESAQHWLRTDLDPAPYPAFMVLLVSLEGALLFSSSDQGPGRWQEIEDTWTMICSSQQFTPEVLHRRREAFRQWLEQGAPFTGPVPRFPLMQPPAGAWWAPLMEREISSTRSITQVEVARGANEVLLRYSPVQELNVPWRTWRLPWRHCPC